MLYCNIGIESFFQRAKQRFPFDLLILVPSQHRKQHLTCTEKNIWMLHQLNKMRKKRGKII